MNEGKFDTVKVGDVVYIQKRISTGWRSGKDFWMPTKVVKITPKQFQVNGNKYRKSDGGIVSSSSYGCCKSLGEKFGYSGAEVVTDETEEYNAMIKRLKSCSEISDIRDKIKPDEDMENLDDIYKHMKAIESLL